jgi:hypothetical protein
MIVYIDESGDLGWKFDQPYRKGGSSRYLTIASLLVPNELKQHPKRIIRKLYKKKHVSPSVEIKGSQLTHDDKDFFVTNLLNLLQKYPDISIITITVRKEHVFSHIRDDGNKLYNYMIGLALLEEIKDENLVVINPDPRSLKVQSGNSLLDYLSIKLWFELNSKTKLIFNSIPSDKCCNLQFIDIASHLIWIRYENLEREFFDRLNPFIKNKCLFF